MLSAPNPFNLSTLDGTNGFRLDGIGEQGHSGGSVSTAGDVNGDGFDDVIIGASGDYPGGDSYVVFGRPGRFSPVLDLSSLDGTNGFRLDGIDATEWFVRSVSTAGDVNGDGFDDLIIGASQADPGDVGDAGESYVVFGQSGGFGPFLDLSTLDGNNGFRIRSTRFDDLSGYSVSTAGDVNGDGFADLIIGAYAFWSSGHDPLSYVVFGKSDSFAPTLELSDLDGDNGFWFLGSGGEPPARVSGGGDINGDGCADMIIGASYTTGLGAETYVVFGKRDGFDPALDLSTLDGTNGSRLDRIGAMIGSADSVSTAGDVNGDGFDDLIIGAQFTGSGGQSYVVFGKPAGFDVALDLSTLDGINGFRLDGIDAGDRCGDSVSAAGDVNGDGFDDLIIGASGGDPGGERNAGESYVVFGKLDGFGSVLDLSTLGGINGFRLDGVDGQYWSDVDQEYMSAGDYSGCSVSEAGDVNGDGFDDLIIGADHAGSSIYSYEGESYVVFGGNFTGGGETQVGDGADNTLTANQGADAADIVIGAQGNDILVSDGGPDVLRGGEGDDTLAIPGTSFRRLAGGAGTDTLRLDGSSATLDLTTIADNRVHDIEVIDIRGYGISILTLNVQEVLNISSTSNTVVVMRDIDDVVDFGAGWTQQPDENINGNVFNVFTQGAATLKSYEAKGFSINDVTTAEGVSGALALTFTVTRTENTDDMSVDYQTSNGTATAGEDFTAIGPTTINFAASGSLSEHVTVQIQGDGIVELDETFYVTLSNPVGAAIADPEGKGVIANDDDATLSIDALTRDEGDAGTTQFEFTVTLSAAVDTPVSVDFATADGTATTADGDYVAAVGTLHFAGNPGETQTLTVNVAADETWENDETFLVNLNNIAASGRDVTLLNGQGQGTIINDDPTGLSINNAIKNEGDAGATLFTFTVTRTDNKGDVSVDYQTSNGTATEGEDFTAIAATKLDFAAGGPLSQDVTVQVSGDQQPELDETFFLNLFSPVNAIILDSQGEGTIANDDHATLSIDDVVKNEGDAGNTQFTFTLTRSENIHDVSVDYSTAPESATAGEDFTAIAATILDFAAGGPLSQDVTVQVSGDQQVELDETFLVRLSNPINATIGTSQGQGTIANDDFATLSIDDVIVDEGDASNTQVTFTVTRSDAMHDVSVDYSTTTGSATTGEDFTGIATTKLDFPAGGPLTQDVTVLVSGDQQVESDETFLVELSNPINATIGDSQGVGTVTNDDQAKLSIDDVTVAEGDSGTTECTFTVTLDTSVDTPVNVDFATADETATNADSDFAIATSSLSFTGAAGEARTATVNVIGDEFVEADETFLVNLSNVAASGRDVTLLDSQGQGTITNDDAFPTTISWDGGGDGSSWQDPLNWDTDLLPGPADDVTIDMAGDFTVVVSSGQHSINSLHSTEAFTLSGGSLHVTSTVQIDNDFLLDGGTLAGARVRPGAAGQKLVITSDAENRLDGVTIDADVSLAQNKAKTKVENGLTLNGTATLEYEAVVEFVGTQSLSGKGILTLARNSRLMLNTTGMTLTIGQDMTVQGDSGAITEAQGSSGCSVVNRGTIIATRGRNTLTSLDLSGVVTVVNHGQIWANGGNLHLQGAVTTTADLRATSGGTLRIQDATVSNTGLKITADGGTVRIADSTITGGSLLATDESGDWIGFGASIVELEGQLRLNGTIWEDPGAGEFRVPSNVTTEFLGDYNRQLPESYELLVQGQLALPAGEFINDGTIRPESSSELQLASNTTLAGSGVVTFNGGLVTGPVGATLTVAADQRIQGGGTIEVDVTNEGLIEGVFEKCLTFEGAVTDLGTLRARSWGRLRFKNVVTFTKGLSASANCRIYFEGATVDATGQTITADGATVWFRDSTLTGGRLLATDSFPSYRAPYISLGMSL